MTRVKPSARQLEFQDWEFGMFLHFGIRTYYEGWRDFDPRPMEPGPFDPVDLDCGQWARVAKSAGMRYMVMTAKHHCGFANWPSATTGFSVKNSAWRGGRGDVIAEFVAACRANDLACGLYYSPYDHTCPAYKDPAAYDDYFIRQIGEILRPYGRIDMLWFDGCGSEGHVYDWPRIIGEIRRMQPEILIFNMGDPDYRWVGNEDGLAPLPCFNTVREVDFSIRTARRETVSADGVWLPAECPCRIRANNWFFSENDEHTIRGLDELIGMYYYTVGRGCNMLINVAPDRRGLIPEKDAARLRELGDELRARFTRPGVRFRDFARQDGRFEYVSDEPFLFDHAVLAEDLSDGEAVRRFRIAVHGSHQQVPCVVYEGRNIGHKAICRFPPVRARKVWIEVIEADGPFELRDIELFRTGR